MILILDVGARVLSSLVSGVSINTALMIDLSHIRKN